RLGNLLAARPLDARRAALQRQARRRPANPRPAAHLGALVRRPRPESETGRLGAANEGDDLAERILPDEVVAPVYSYSDPHRALLRLDLIDPIDLAPDLRLDLRASLGKVDQDHIHELQPLNLYVDRHQAMLRPLAEPR